jgi:hypothetical protein
MPDRTVLDRFAGASQLQPTAGDFADALGKPWFATRVGCILVAFFAGENGRARSRPDECVVHDHDSFGSLFILDGF